MNIHDVLKCESGTIFRIPENDIFEEEFVEVYDNGITKYLLNDDIGVEIPLTEAYINAEYIREN